MAFLGLWDSPHPIPAFILGSLVWRGRLHLVGRVPSGDQASSEVELGRQLSLMLRAL